MNEVIYNGMTLAQIEANLPKNMIIEHKRWYLDNCKDVYYNEFYGVQLSWCQVTRNTNFFIISLYNNIN